MSLGAILIIAQAYLQIRYKYRNIDDLRHAELPEIQELRHEIAIWERAADNMVSYSYEEDLVQDALYQKRDMLEARLQHSITTERTSFNDEYKTTLAQLEARVFFKFEKKKLIQIIY